MKTDVKSYTLSDLKMDVEGKEGTFEAVFATMNVVDKDGDITVNGAFGQQDVVISQWNHGSWKEGAAALPIGVGKIYEVGDKALVSGEFDMNDPDAVKTYNKFKYMKSKGRNIEFSYALPKKEFDYIDMNGERRRRLKKIQVPEVSPVLMGAGMDTELLSVKNAKQSIPIKEHFETVQAAVKGLVDRITSLGELREAEGRHPSEETLQSAAQLKSELSDLICKLDEVQVKHNNSVYGELIRFEQINFEIGGIKHA